MLTCDDCGADNLRSCTAKMRGNAMVRLCDQCRKVDDARVTARAEAGAP